MAKALSHMHAPFESKLNATTSQSNAHSDALTFALLETVRLVLEERHESELDSPEAPHSTSSDLSSDSYPHVAAASRKKPASKSAGVPGGPCAHCGASESPQWRRPLTKKVVLCNACGIYYSRHHSLPKRKKEPGHPQHHGANDENDDEEDDAGEAEEAEALEYEISGGRSSGKGGASAHAKPQRPQQQQQGPPAADRSAAMQIDSSGGCGGPRAAVRATLHLRADSATRSHECEVHHLDPAAVGGGALLQGESASSESMHHYDVAAGGHQQPHRLGGGTAVSSAAVRPPDLSTLQLSSGGGARRVVVLHRHPLTSSGVAVHPHCPASPGGSGGTPTTSTFGSGRSTPTAPQSTPKKRGDGGAEHLDALFDAHQEDSLIRRAMKRSMANQLHGLASGSSVTTLPAAAAVPPPPSNPLFWPGSLPAADSRNVFASSYSVGPIAAVQRPAITTSLPAAAAFGTSSASLLHHHQGAGAGAGGSSSVLALQQQQQVQLNQQKQQLSQFLEAMLMRSQAAQGMMHAPAAVAGTSGMPPQLQAHSAPVIEQSADSDMGTLHRILIPVCVSRGPRSRGDSPQPGSPAAAAAATRC